MLVFLCANGDTLAMYEEMKKAFGPSAIKTVPPEIHPRGHHKGPQQADE